LPAEELQALKSEVAAKIRMIEKFASQQDKVFGLTGYSSAADLCEELFVLVGIVELQQHAYAETECSLTKS
jgi:hypothetical protein